MDILKELTIREIDELADYQTVNGRYFGIDPLVDREFVILLRTLDVPLSDICYINIFMYVCMFIY